VLEDLVEIRKRSALEEADQPEPEPMETTLAIPKLTGDFYLAAAGI
jgi:hypothetical protein